MALFTAGLVERTYALRGRSLTSAAANWQLAHCGTSPWFTRQSQQSLGNRIQPRGHLERRETEGNRREIPALAHHDLRRTCDQANTLIQRNF